MKTLLTGLVAAMAAVLVGAQAAPTLPRLTIEPSERPRRDVWVHAALPPSVRGTDLQLRGEDGVVLPLQVGPDRQAWAIVPELPADRRVSYVIEPAVRATVPDALTVRADGSHRIVERSGRPMFRYVGDPLALPSGVGERYRRGGYIHPVQTPTGVEVTEDFPPNHLHHHGIWAAWTSTRLGDRKPDFWNMGDGTGRIEFEGVGASWSGALTAGFEARHRYVDLTGEMPQTVLTERWAVTAYAADLGARPAHVFDVAITQRLTGQTPLQLPAYRYGGIGLRGRHLWDGPTKTHILTADGRDRRNGHGTRATWAHMSGDVEGKRVGIAVLGHPDNPSSPQPMRIHPTEPFFNFALQQAGAFTIRPGDTFAMRYRFVAFDGPPDARALDELWQDWATPVRATVR